MTSVLRPKKILTLFVDFGLSYLALFAALTVRHLEVPPAGRYLQGVLPFGIVAMFYIVVFYLSGLYTLQDLRTFARKLQRTVTAFVASTGLAFIVFYFMPDDSYSPKTILLLYSLFFFLFFLLWRNVADSLLGVAYPSLKVGFLGWDPILTEILGDAGLLKTYNLDVRFLFLPDAGALSHDVALSGLEVSGSTEDLEARLKSEQPDLLVINANMSQEAEVRELLFRRLSRRATYMSLPELYEMTMARVPINAINQMWFLEHLQFRNKAAYEKIKRLTDFIGGVLALVITLPLWPLIAVLVKLSGKGPVLFRQTRCGLNGHHYTIFKFRTMRTENNPFGMTVEGDARITGVGRFLRKSRLDELPQLINIIRGDMSFVGPRPERPEIIEELEKEVPFYRQRMLVTPGLTGWDQVSGEYHSASVEDTYKKLQYDLYYVKNRSSYLDAIIVLKTIATVFRRAGR